MFGLWIVVRHTTFQIPSRKQNGTSEITFRFYFPQVVFYLFFILSVSGSIGSATNWNTIVSDTKLFTWLIEVCLSMITTLLPVLHTTILSLESLFVCEIPSGDQDKGLNPVTELPKSGWVYCSRESWRGRNKIFQWTKSILKNGIQEGSLPTRTKVMFWCVIVNLLKSNYE